MDFEKKYKKYSKKQYRKQFTKKTKFVGGSGGSRNLIYIGKKYVYKIIPFTKKNPNQLKRLDSDQKEINVYKILTNEFILNNRTPHLVGIYDNYKINIKSILGRCPSLYDFYFKKINLSRVDRNICGLANQLKLKQLVPKADVVVIELCKENISEYYSKNILKKRNKYKNTKKFLERIIFQIIFTLAIIQQKYPTFVHNDLFLRNILGTIEDKYSKNDYIEYIFNNKKFYFLGNGFIAKINDFGETLEMKKMISTNIMFINHRFNKSIDCQKCDIFNFLHDLYDGQNMGAESIMSMIKNKKLKKDVKKIFNKFIKTNSIDKINKNNKRLLDWTWKIKDKPFLKELVKTPKEYLESNIFKEYMTLPKNGNVIKSYS